MSQCVEKLPHEECGSSDALQVFVDNKENYTAYCFSCDKYVPDPYGEGGTPAEKPKLAKSKEEIEQEIEEISLLPSRDLPDRALTASTLQYFEATVGVSEEDGSTPVFVHYPYYKGSELTGYKVRFIPGKKFWAVGDIKPSDLFGWRQAVKTGSPTLFITEGENDAMALYQALKDKNRNTKWADYDPAVASLKNGGSGAARELTAQLRGIRAHFKDVVFVFDMDEAGREAVEAGMAVIPSARTVSLPEKDPNDCLVKGFANALCNAVLFRSEKPKNTRLIWASEVIEDAKKTPEMGMSWPWEGMTEITRGFRWGETVYIGAGVKMGKTTIVDSLAAHFITEHGLKVFMAQPEEVVSKTTRRIVGKVAKRIFHDPKIEFDEEAYDLASPVISKNLLLLNLFQSLEWETLRSDIIDAVDKGCQVVFIDPITNITNGINSADANTLLQGFAQEISTLAKDLNILVLLFCHLKSPDFGAPHERGGAVYSSQFAGSRAMMRSCNLMLGLEGNKDPDLPEEERNMRRLIILEDREFGESGYIPLYYNDQTGIMTELSK